VIANLPAIVFCEEEQGREVRDRFGSFYNEFEAQAIAQIILLLLQYGLRGSHIGVIALCRSSNVLLLFPFH